MNIDFERDRDDLISLEEAAAMIPSPRTGGTVDASTLHRWRTRGINGVRLECVRAGHPWLTTRAAVRRFIDRISGNTTELDVMQAEADRCELDLRADGAIC